MTQGQSFRVLIAHMFVSILILAGATTLCALGKLQSDALIAIYGAAIGLMGGNAQSLGTAAINGGPKPNLDRMAETSTRDALIASGSMRKTDTLEDAAGDAHTAATA